ncbi:tetraspanin-8-like [Typha latifolia]|uniref:tetraspanin-8-like n=1 Tax=Typha latifolia TaxID=4733 RepID=UPI003C2F53E2
MVRISIGLLGTQNLILLLSIPVTGIRKWFRFHAASECKKFLQWPVIILGVFLLVVSLLGLFGSCYRVSFLWMDVLFHCIDKRVGDSMTWKEINSCMNDAKVCGGFDGDVGLKANEFYKLNLSPIQVGECSLAVRFPQLFHIVWDEDVIVNDVWTGKDVGI